MSKYINADELKDKITEDFGLKNEMSCFDIVATIMDFPSVDIVRCKDCIKYKPFENENYPCGECGNCSYDVPPRIVQEDGFCNEGERKESKVKRCFDIPKDVAERLLEDTERKEAYDRQNQTND